MIFYFFRELNQQGKSASDWLTAFALFAGTSFILAWPIRHDHAVIATIGPSTTLALLFLSQFLIFSRFWHDDVKSEYLEVLSTSPRHALERYASGRLVAAIVTGLIYSLVTTSLGSILYALDWRSTLTLLLQVFAVAPGITALSILTAAATSRTTKASSAIGIVILLPMIAPFVILMGVYSEQTNYYDHLLVPSWFSLIGLSIAFVTMGVLSLPTILKAQL